jgi:hypothetical protein
VLRTVLFRAEEGLERVAVENERVGGIVPIGCVGKRVMEKVAFRTDVPIGVDARAITGGTNGHCGMFSVELGGWRGSLEYVLGKEVLVMMEKGKLDFMVWKKG